MKFIWHTYKARFWNAKPIQISATNPKQAEIIAQSLAKKNGWKIESIGRA